MIMIQAELMLTMTGLVEMGETQVEEDDDTILETRTQKTQELTVSPLIIGDKRLNSTGKEPQKKVVIYMDPQEIVSHEDMSKRDCSE